MEFLPVPATKNYTAKLDLKFEGVYEQYIKKDNIYLNTINWDIRGCSTVNQTVFSESAKVAWKQQSPQQATKNLDQKLATLR